VPIETTLKRLSIKWRRDKNGTLWPHTGEVKEMEPIVVISG
jgi:hypothetical protein